MAYDTVQIHELDKSTSVSGLDYVLLSQNEEAKACTVEKIRNIGATIDEGGWDKTASNEGVKQLKTELAIVKNDVDDLKNSSSGSNTNITKLQTDLNDHVEDDSIHVRKSTIGDLTTLNTTNQNDLVSAINEVNADTGISAGSYARVYVNEKGKVTNGGTLVEGDIPNLPFSKITGLGTCATKDVGMGIGNVPVINSDGLLDATIIPTCYGVATGTDNYEVIINDVGNFGDYMEGMIICVKIPNDSTGASTIDVNGWGATPILDNLGNAISAGGLKANIPYNLCYNGSDFIVLGKGGGGNATPDKLIKGYTATTDSGQITGIMDKRHEFYITDKFDSGLNMRDDTFTISTAQIDNAICGKINLSDVPFEYIGDSANIYVQNLLSRYVASGVKIGGDRGFTGTFTNDANAQAEHMLSGYSAYVNSNKINGNIPVLTGIRKATGVARWSDNGLAVYPERGYQKGGAGDGEIKVSQAQLINTYGITANKIVSGQEIAGVWGTAITGALYNNGTINHVSGTSDTITLPFSPVCIYIYYKRRSNSAEIHYIICTPVNTVGFELSPGSGTTTYFKCSGTTLTVSSSLSDGTVIYKAYA